MDTNAKTGSLHFTLSTYLYSLYTDNIKPSSPAIQHACANIEAVGNKPLKSLAIQSVQDVLKSQFGSAPNEQSVAELIKATYSEENYTTQTPNELGKALVDSFSEGLPADADFSALCDWLGKEFSQDQFMMNFDGTTREELVSSIRKYIYQKGRPWLAQIADRRNDQLITQWVMV
ncbi:MAG: hypothetical protein VX278_01260, partial [Myxococcota bacterium]|nr:hypothetical protein [Myxococcota bacterium]